MKRKKVLDLIGNGKFFSVVFTKRTNGEERKLVGRYGVTKGTLGHPPYDDSLYNLVTVWDSQNQGFRKIPCESISEIRCNGRVWRK